ncbi:MAG: thiamine pyrophosphate-binding protein, partial [Deltaproteobacteria bacterium]|nr:thiamine pyrophosphate-binding protein [Deltaproteobacteria bacterium]
MLKCEYNQITQNLGPDYAQNVPTTGHSLKTILKYFNIDVAYGIGGDYVAGLIEVLHPEVNILPGSNELNAAFAACGHAEIRGIGCCIMTYTVGSLPAISAAALAIAENIPVIFLSGAPGENEIGETFLHHTVVNHRNLYPRYDAALNAFQAIGVRAERLQGKRGNLQPSNASIQFLELVHYAWKNSQPVFIEIPRDLIAQPTQPLTLPSSPKLLQAEVPLVAGNLEIIPQIKHKLLKSKHPLIFLGQFIKRDRSLRECILKFSKEHNIPFVTSWLAKGFFDEDDALCKGAYNGIFSPEHIRSIEHDVDYIIEIGTSIQRQDINYAFNSETQWLSDFENKTRLTGALLESENLQTMFKELSNGSEPKNSPLTQNQISVFSSKTEQTLSYSNIASALNQTQNRLDRTMVYLPAV